MIYLSGRLICTNEQDVRTLRAHLPEHIRLSRAESGCLSFDVSPTDDPLIWSVQERFTDQAAFDTHQTRTRASEWFRATNHIQRDYRVTDGTPTK